jgi:hypothetical protein
MIQLPDKYSVGAQGKQLNKKNFLAPTHTTVEKRRLRECLSKIVLTHQIAGEEIPSLIDSYYNCAVILFLDIELTDLKHKDFVAKTLQPLMKPFAVFHLHDTRGQHAYAFAHKRLNKADTENIIIEHCYCTAATTPTTADSPIAFPHLVNRNNKRDLYLEAMTKAFLIDNPKVFIGAESLLDTKLWYHGDPILQLYQKLTQLLSLKQQKSTAKTNATKATLNTQIKSAITDLKSFTIHNS